MHVCNACMVIHAKYHCDISVTFLLMYFFSFEPCGVPAEFKKCDRRLVGLGVCSQMNVIQRDILGFFNFLHDYFQSEFFIALHEWIRIAHT